MSNRLPIYPKYAFGSPGTGKTVCTQPVAYQNCRNCGAPHTGICQYCGTHYYPLNSVHNKNTAALWQNMPPAAFIAAVCAGYVLLIKKTKKYSVSHKIRLKKDG